ncbi:hypothetical protein M6B38_395600 [Iris pallida]|uniref:Uncharacterized protein n=1 Tax=Iris pallida TaxID=29817 RepID=A0AAX6FWU7_IRIPA|nr:hypothetical protein M6B38_395600 [Iris pallida]
MIINTKWSWTTARARGGVCCDRERGFRGMIKGGICRPRRIQKGLTGCLGAGLGTKRRKCGVFSRYYQGVPVAQHDR